MKMKGNVSGQAARARRWGGGGVGGGVWEKATSLDLRSYSYKVKWIYMAGEEKACPAAV